MTPPRLVATAIAAALLVAVGCGDDDEGDGQSARTGGVQRYCDLARQLDRAGEQFFKRLEQENASAKEFEAAERRFVELHEADIDEVQRVAPEPIADDITTLLAALRARAGLGPPVSEARAGAAEERVQKFDKRSCR